MTPAEHLEAAEALVATGPDLDDPGHTVSDIAMMLTALVHTTIAIGDLLGAPHSGPATGVPSAPAG